MTVEEIINTKDIKRIDRRIKNVRGCSRTVRERNVCPNCNSMDVAKRTTTKDYKCYNCKWIGKNVNKIMT
jgi:ribosomal protein L37AE/L43A